jgi:uncharacterized protein involved in exopolysaccharide biosynthesis
MPLQASQMSVHEILEVIFQNKWRFFLSVFLGLSIACLYTRLTDKVYEAKAEIRINDRSANEPLLQGLGVTTTMAQRFTTMRSRLLAPAELKNTVQAILSDPRYQGQRPFLEKHAKAFDAAQELSGSVFMDIRGGVLTIRAERQNPDEALAVVETLEPNVEAELQRFSGDRLTSITGTLAGLLEKYKNLLTKNEEDLRDFKSYNQIDLAGTQEDMLRMANNLDAVSESPKGLLARLISLLDRHSSNELELQALSAKCAAIESQIQAEPEFRVKEFTTGQSEMHKQMEALLAKALTELETIRKDRSDAHPLVRDKMDEIARYRAKLEELGSPVVREEQKTANPVREGLKMQLASLKAEIESKRKEQEHLVSQSKELQMRVAKIPEKELERMRINREVSIQQSMYNDIHLRYEKAKLTRSLEEAETLTFERLGAFKNPNPIRPNSRFILLMGTFLGMAFGIAWCFLKEFTDTSFRNLEDASRFLDLPILGVIPEMAGIARRQAKRRRRAAA